jgi:alpha-ketoglutarate-dependent 2,4-dichlorophenoxyacetate dioxygenase
VHPGSGRTTLYLAAHAAHIIGMPVPEGRLLLRDLMEHATQREYVYTHHWKENDLVVWDNRCTMHRGRPFPEDEPRDMRRVTTADAAVAREHAA